MRHISLFFISLRLRCRDRSELNGSVILFPVLGALSSLLHYVLLFHLGFSLFIFASCVCFIGNSYRDILHHHKKGFYHKGSDEDSSVMDAYIMHSVSILLWVACHAFLLFFKFFFYI